MQRYLLLFSMAAVLSAAVDFGKDVAPVLETRCHVCHGAKQQMSALRLDQAEGAAKVTLNGKLVERIKSTKAGHRMPPVGAPLTAKEIAAFEEWIAAGAKWPMANFPYRSIT